jgi:predicted ATP-binding protein involved in virulence
LEAGEEKMTPLTPIESLFKPEILLNASLAWIKDQHLRSLENRAGAASTINIVKNVLSSEGLLPNGIKIEDINADGVFLKTSDNVILQINEFSDGVKSTLALTLELLRLLLYKYGYLPIEQSINQTGVISVPGIVLIDEIDVHLHPTWQTRIGQWFTRFFPKIQFIVTTHSPLICRASRNGSIWRLAVPDSGKESSQVTGDQLNQLIHGNVLDAYETQVFGKNIERDQEDQTELEKYSYLSQMEVYNPTSLTNIQRNQLELLKKTYKTHAPFAVKTY